MDKNKEDKLTIEAKKHIDKYLYSRLFAIAAFLFVANAGLLYGIYTKVAESAASNAADKAIISTEKKLASLSEQFNQLAALTTNGLAEALMSVGEAKAKTEAINQDILGLKNLDLNKVKKVTELLNKSTNEIKTLINSARIYKEATDKIIDYKDLIITNQNSISSSQIKLSSLKSKLDKTNKWVLYSYSSANKHGIWKNSKGENHEVHIKWQQDHIDKYQEINNELK